MPNYQNKTKDELIKELQELHLECDSLKISYEKDITERKQVEETLKFTQMILDNAADTMTCIDYDGHYIDVNEALCRSVGYSREELLSMTVHDIDPNYPAGIWPEFMEKLKQTGSLTFESLHRTKEGKLIPVEVRVSFFEHNGKEYHSGFARDITERKQAEELLKESMERFNEAQKLAHIGVWDWKPDTDTVTWTDELYHIAGLDPMLPAPNYYNEHPNLYTPESWELLKTSVEKAMETGESYQLELELIRPNGDIRYVNAFGGAKYDSKGQVNGLFGSVQDITERKQAEDEIRKSKKLLEDLHKHLNEIRENERASISREIHDQIGQSLTVLKLDMNWMRNYMNNNPDAEIFKQADYGIIGDWAEVITALVRTLRQTRRA